MRSLVLWQQLCLPQGEQNSNNDGDQDSNDGGDQNSNDGGDQDQLKLNTWYFFTIEMPSLEQLYRDYHLRLQV